MIEKQSDRERKEGKRNKVIEKGGGKKQNDREQSDGERKEGKRNKVIEKTETGYKCKTQVQDDKKKRRSGPEFCV